MPIFLDPRGRPTYGLRVCDRCNRKFFLNELKPDRNSPGLMVCDADNDVYDPWRLPFVPADRDISLRRPRPDTPITNDVCYTVDPNDGAVIVGACPVDTSVTPSSD